MTNPVNFRRTRIVRFIKQEALNIMDTAKVLKASGIDPDRYVEGGMRVLNRLEVEFGITKDELRP